MAKSEQQHRDLLTLPSEVLQTILEAVDPQDLSPLSRTCRTLDRFIRSNNVLWKKVYLKAFDPPSSDSQDPGDAIQWKKQLQAIVMAQKVLASDDEQVKRDSFTPVARTIVSMLRNARGGAQWSSPNVEAIRAPFKKELNQNVFLCSSSLFHLAGTLQHQPFETDEDKQLSAQLHCLYGAPRWAWDTGDDTQTHPFARARVYDIRRFTEGSFWGPFKDDHSSDVDWEKLEAIITVLGFNLKQMHVRSNGMFDLHWHDTHAWLGASPYSFHPIIRQPNAPLDDPYAVTGKYLRIVCYLDYFEFFSFNFRTHRPPANEDRDPLDAEEARRLIIMNFQATHVESPGPADHPGMPVVHFRGKSRAMVLSTNDDNANSEIIGTVRTTKSGEVRWTTFSVYSGEQRWRSEGIQVGGIQSARGVIGNWFDKNYDPHGPAGPTAFWKTSHDLPNKDDVDGMTKHE